MARADSMSLPTSFVLPADEDVHGNLRALPPRANGGDHDSQRGPFVQVTGRPSLSPVTGSIGSRASGHSECGASPGW
jgi:hypothetical protein